MMYAVYWENHSSVNRIATHANAGKQTRDISRFVLAIAT